MRSKLLTSLRCRGIRSGKVTTACMRTLPSTGAQQRHGWLTRRSCANFDLESRRKKSPSLISEQEESAGVACLRKLLSNAQGARQAGAGYASHVVWAFIATAFQQSTILGSAYYARMMVFRSAKDITRTWSERQTLRAQSALCAEGEIKTVPSLKFNGAHRQQIRNVEPVLLALRHSFESAVVEKRKAIAW